MHHFGSLVRIPYLVSGTKITKKRLQWLVASHSMLRTSYSRRNCSAKHLNTLFHTRNVFALGGYWDLRLRNKIRKRCGRDARLSMNLIRRFRLSLSVRAKYGRKISRPLVDVFPRID